MLAEERQRSNELLQLLEKKSLMCEDCQMGEEMHVAQVKIPSNSLSASLTYFEGLSP